MEALKPNNIIIYEFNDTKVVAQIFYWFKIFETYNPLLIILYLIFTIIIGNKGKTKLNWFKNILNQEQI